MKVNSDTCEIERNSFTISRQPLSVFLVHEPPEFRERPSERGARIIGKFPKQFAKRVPSLRSAPDGEESKQCPRFPRWRQCKRDPCAPNFKLANDAYVQVFSHVVGFAPSRLGPLRCEV